MAHGVGGHRRLGAWLGMGGGGGAEVPPAELGSSSPVAMASTGQGGSGATARGKKEAAQMACSHRAFVAVAGVGGGALAGAE